MCLLSVGWGESVFSSVALTVGQEGAFLGADSLCLSPYHGCCIAGWDCISVGSFQISPGCNLGGRKTRATPHKEPCLLSSVDLCVCVCPRRVSLVGQAGDSATR